MSDTVQRLLQGDARALSRLITLLERGDPRAARVLQEVAPHTGRAYCVGLTGPPGSGKSTLADRLTERLRQQGRRVGIVAVDPTSPFSGGAVLGDRIRMQRHSLDSGVYIRSMATRGSLGGLSRVVKSTARLMDAAGCDVVLVETAGVGQTEVAVMGVADTVVVVLVPEAGDAVQTLKAGLLEVADLFVVNKADRPGAGEMVAALHGMLGLVEERRPWTPRVLTTQAHRGEGVDKLWQAVEEHRRWLEAEGHLEARRRVRLRREFLETVEEALALRLRELLERDPGLAALVQGVEERQADPYAAALRLLHDGTLLRPWLASLAGDPAVQGGPPPQGR